MALNYKLQSALHKYAFLTNNPTGKGLPASVTAPKPSAPLGPSLTDIAQNNASAAKLRPAGAATTPKLTGLASASIGAAPTGKPATFSATAPNNSSLLGLDGLRTNSPATSSSGQTNPALAAVNNQISSVANGTAQWSPQNANPNNQTFSLAGTAATPPTGSPAQTMVTGGSAPAAPAPASAPASSPQTTQPMPPTGTLSLNPDGSVNTGTAQSGTTSVQSPAMTLSGGSSTISATPAAPAGSKPMTMDLKAQDSFAADLQKLPPDQAKAKAQEGVQAHFQALPKEEQKGVQDLSAGKTDTPEAKQFEAKVEGPVKEQYVRDEYGKQVANNPDVTPQQAGGIMNGIMEGWNNMPTEMKWMMGIGLGGGLLGVLSSMFGGGGGGAGLLGILGLGAAGLAGAAGGMFGQGAQDMLGGALGSIGQATGMIPKDVNLDALKGDNAVQKLTNESSGGGILGGLKAWWDPKGTAEKVKGQLAQTDQLKRLMMVPEGMRPGLLKQISPNSSPQEIQQILANAKSVHGAMSDPKSQLAQNVAKGREFSANPEKYIRDNSWFGSMFGGSAADNVDPDRRGAVTDMALYSNPISGTAAGIYDIGRNAYEGDWWGVGRGALNTASSFIPGGSLLKGLGRAGLQTVSHMMKPASDRGYALAREWAKEADDKATKEWLQKFRARGQKGRWVNTRRGSKTEKRITASTN